MMVTDGPQNRFGVLRPNISAEELPVEGADLEEVTRLQALREFLVEQGGLDPEEVDRLQTIHDPEKLEDLMEVQRVLDRVRVSLGVKSNQEALLKAVMDQHPEANGHAEKLLEEMKLSVEQAQKKTSYFQKVRTFILTLAPVVAGAALLYYTGAGAYVVAKLEALLGSNPDAVIKSVMEGVKKLGGGSVGPIGLEDSIGVAGTGMG